MPGLRAGQRRMHFDPASQRLISVNGDVWLIDPETGTVSYFWNLVFVPTATAFDPVARRIFALAGSPGPAQTVEIFDMATKEAKFIEIASIRYYGFLEWDPVSRRLLSATSEQCVPIVSIDPETSLVETLVNTGSNILPYRSALDVQGGRLFFLSFVVAPGTPFNTAWSLYTVNLRNRSVTAVRLDTQTSYGLLEFAPGAAPVPPAVPVPMLNLAGMLIFGVGIAAAGFILIRWIR